MAKQQDISAEKLEKLKGVKVMAYAIGYMLPIILVVGGIAWFLMALAEDSKNKRDIQKLVDKNSQIDEVAEGEREKFYRQIFVIDSANKINIKTGITTFFNVLFHIFLC